MARILRTLPDLEDDDELVALMDREPVFLYPELERRGYGWDIVLEGDGYRLTIRRNSA